MIQRRMKLGYNRAGRIMDQLEGLGNCRPGRRVPNPGKYCSIQWMS